MKHFATWWVALWGLMAPLLIGLAFVLPFHWWAVAVFFGFGTMEGIGIFDDKSGHYPPLTDVVSTYAPRSLAIPAIIGLTGGAGCCWLQVAPLKAFITTAVVTLGAWFFVHFSEAYGH